MNRRLVLRSKVVNATLDLRIRLEPKMKWWTQDIWLERLAHILLWYVLVPMALWPILLLILIFSDDD